MFYIATYISGHVAEGGYLVIEPNNRRDTSFHSWGVKLPINRFRLIDSLPMVIERPIDMSWWGVYDSRGAGLAGRRTIPEYERPKRG